MLEVVIIISVILMITSINIILFNKTFTTSIYQKEIDILKSSLNHARQMATNQKQIVNISFDNRKFIIKTPEFSKETIFKSLSFQKSKELYFNINGTLNQAYTLPFKDGFKYRKLIFYLGKSWYKIE